MKKNYTIILGVVVSIGYILGIIYLYSKSNLGLTDLLNSLTTFVGWILALIIGFVHLHKTRGDSILALKEETRKSLQIDAFRDINSAVSEFSGILGEIYSGYAFLPGKLDLHVKNPQLFRFDKNEIMQKLHDVTLKIWNGSGNLYLSIESNEMAVLEYDHLRKYIHFVVEDLDKLAQSFIAKWGMVRIEAFSDPELRATFAAESLHVSEKAMDLQSYLFDYRIELMNGMLGDIFDRKVPNRLPLDKKHKTLSELAIRSNVLAEYKSRSEKALVPPRETGDRGR